jgi:hypothetical protein
MGNKLSRSAKEIEDKLFAIKTVSIKIELSLAEALNLVSLKERRPPADDHQLYIDRWEQDAIDNLTNVGLLDKVVESVKSAINAKVEVVNG